MEGEDVARLFTSNTPWYFLDFASDLTASDTRTAVKVLKFIHTGADAYVLYAKYLDTCPYHVIHQSYVRL